MGAKWEKVWMTEKGEISQMISQGYEESSETNKKN